MGMFYIHRQIAREYKIEWKTRKYKMKSIDIMSLKSFSSDIYRSIARASSILFACVFFLLVSLFAVAVIVIVF